MSLYCLFPRKNPPFASSVVLEVREPLAAPAAGSFDAFANASVRVYYNIGLSDLFGAPQLIPGCPAVDCPFFKFKRYGILLLISSSDNQRLACLPFCVFVLLKQRTCRCD